MRFRKYSLLTTAEPIARQHRGECGSKCGKPGGVPTCIGMKVVFGEQGMVVAEERSRLVGDRGEMHLLLRGGGS